MVNAKKARKSSSKKAQKPLIGFIGQGWIGKNYAEDFERRGYPTARYALEEPYRNNKELIKDAAITFIAVPTPTTPTGYSAAIVEEALKLIAPSNVAVIKSTMLPGTTRKLQEKFPHIIVLFAPEFLSVASAAHDAAHPFSNVIGMPLSDAKHRAAAERVHAVLPSAPFDYVTTSEEAELYKYAHNVAGFMQVVTYNALYDVAEKLGADWEQIYRALQADPMVSNWYIRPVHKTGRGAGGECFIKDFAAFTDLYERIVGKPEGIAFLRAAEGKNIKLLVDSNKDIPLLKAVYGDAIASGRQASKTAKKPPAKQRKSVRK